MKIRTGFVSNSSSSSFLVSVSAYKSVFALALAMLKIRNDDWTDSSKSELNSEKKAILASEMDQNTPVAFTTTNYDTYIVRCGDVYAVSTCNNHNFSTALDGVTHTGITPELAALLGMDKQDIDKMDLGQFVNDIEYDLPYTGFFWWPDHGCVIHKEKSEMGVEKDMCKKHGKFDCALVEWKHPSGVIEVVCPMCQFGKQVF
jgi:hypothetical protein